MINNIKYSTNGNNTYYHKYLKYKKKYLELSQTNKLLGGRPTPTSSSKVKIKNQNISVSSAAN